MPEPKIVLSPLVEAQMAEDPEMASALAAFGEMMKSAMSAIGPREAYESQAAYEAAMVAKLEEYGVRPERLDPDEEEALEARMSEDMERLGVTAEEMEEAEQKAKEHKQ